jgi:hypothetical protein
MSQQQRSLPAGDDPGTPAKNRTFDLKTRKYVLLFVLIASSLASQFRGNLRGYADDVAFRNFGFQLAPMFLGDDSVLVPMDDIPEDERKFVPGAYRFGEENMELFIYGASITSEYDSPETLWFQFFALGDKVFDPNMKQKPCVPVGNYTIPPQAKWKQMEKELFFCKVGNQTVSAILVPTRGVDPHTNSVVQVWRCPLHGVPGQSAVLSSFDFEKFRHEPSDVVALPITVMHSNGTGLSHVVQIFLPSTKPLVGLSQILSHSPQPLLQQRHNITLCLISFANGLKSLNEFLRYHQDVLGIDHVHLGLEAQYDGKTDLRVSNLAEHMFRHDIQGGKLSISLVSDDLMGIYCPQYEYRQAIFYQNCLYHAKTTSEFVAAWDLDEYFVFLNDHRNRSLPDFLREIHHPPCPDWSFVTMLSSTAGGVVNQRTGFASLDYPRRENKTNSVWHKSISKTKNTFLKSIHIDGSCIPNGTGNLSDVTVMKPWDGQCAFYTDEAIMVHLKGIHSQLSRQLTEPTVLNELQNVLLANSAT